MNGIYKLTRGMQSTAGYAGISCTSRHDVGDLFYREPYECGKEGVSNWHPLRGGYCMWDYESPIEPFMELLFETDKPKEYYLDRKYTQYQVDQMTTK